MDMEQEMRRLQDIEANYKTLLKSFADTTSLRDQFAMAALPPLIQGALQSDHEAWEAAAKHAYIIADEMMVERDLS